MKKQKLKDIILCQGDKKELEEITGDNYEYVSTFKVRTEFDSSKNSLDKKNQYFVMSTFLSSSTSICSLALREEISFEAIWDEVVMCLYSKMYGIGADALIHYKENAAIGYTEDQKHALDICEFYAKGTPVRKVKN